MKKQLFYIFCLLSMLNVNSYEINAHDSLFVLLYAPFLNQNSDWYGINAVSTFNRPTLKIIYQPEGAGVASQIIMIDGD